MFRLFPALALVAVAVLTGVVRPPLAEAVAADDKPAPAITWKKIVLDRKFLNKAFAHLSASARDMIEAMSTGEFPAKPSRWQCPRCDFRTVCDEGRSAYPA